ncbi:MAG: DNA mismatch repair endonuclease MutL [Proteobacteria bacterium]|nr:DNA mismatch repair endonuclease MutL [Pseudomonadota bacterium]MBU1709645.1 DNA mismatch repair endonuclease MutL [Pseudomonadota bacterium]
MSKIKILPENLANQIAAGEVVERPASVVKEFIENAIDAGARHITIQIEGGGTRLIRVIDDGAGMDQDDLLLCLERHATSKLIDERQLGEIKTLGFRGEAIPSIASVSRLTIISRPAAASLGSKVEVRYGTVLKVHETGSFFGTVMEVKDLFSNVPARKKFLKSTRTELFHIEEVIRNYGLALHQLGISYSVNNKEIINLPADSDSPEERVLRLLGGRSGGLLISLGKRDVETESSAGISVSGLLFPPEDMGVNARLRMFVNGRIVRDRMVAHAVAEGMRGFLMKGGHPAGVIFIDLPCGDIDVNVHPTKQEIRFHKPNVVHQLIILEVSKALRRFQEELKYSLFGTPIISEEERPSREEGLSARQAPFAIEHQWVRQSVFPKNIKAAEPAATPGYTSLFGDNNSEKNEPQHQQVAYPDSEQVPATSACGMVIHESFFDSGATSVTMGWSFIRPIGQLMNSYLLCETDKGLVVIDQHAAQERLIFEELKKDFSRGAIAGQKLLFPKVLEFEPEERAMVKEYENEIAALGVELEEFGGASYVIKAVPAILKDLLPEEVLQGIFERFSARGNDAALQSPRGMESVLAGLACKAAIKAGHSLQDEEIEHLLAKMQEADVFSHCPHGRPVVKCFTGDEIKKWFRRT